MYVCKLQIELIARTSYKKIICFQLYTVTDIYKGSTTSQ